MTFLRVRKNAPDAIRVTGLERRKRSCEFSSPSPSTREGMSARRPARQNGSLDLVIADADIRQAALELVERYGSSALEIAQKRVESLSAAQDHSAINVALRVLSAVEGLFSAKPK